MYTEEHLKNWISERLPNGIKSLTISIRNSKLIQESLNCHTQDHQDLTFSAKANIVFNGSRPVCVVCKSYTYFNRNRWEFAETCSVKCAANNKRRNDQIKKTLIEKYGEDNISKTEYFKITLKKHNQETHGVDHYFQSNDYKVKNIDTCNAKYGVNSYTQTDEFKEKSRVTSIKKYGTDHPMKSLEVFEKQQKNSFYFKDYTMPSGVTLRVQGYEDKAINELLKTYSENQLIISNKDIFEKCGSFEYIHNDSKHRYYPDIYIPSENKIIEVKSTRTYEVQKYKNLLKQNAVIDKGFLFEFWIYGKTGKTII